MNINKLSIIIFCLTLSIYDLRQVFGNEEYDKCVKEKIEEAGENMDYVYQAIIIQTCTAETKEQNNNDS